GNPSMGWLFPGPGDRPLHQHSFSHRVIKPMLKEKGLPWKGLYAGRRGGATALTSLMGDPLAASQLLGHKNMGVTMSHYAKHDPRKLAEGMKLLEAKTTRGD